MVFGAENHNVHKEKHCDSQKAKTSKIKMRNKAGLYHTEI